MTPAPAHAADPDGQQTFEYTGGVQTFTVPKGICSLDVDLFGAAGGAALGGMAAGGAGAGMSVHLKVKPDDTVTVKVGGAGGAGAGVGRTPGGYNGGGTGGPLAGGGGGATTVTTPYDEAIAGGGGGAGYGTLLAVPGGDAGAEGRPGGIGGTDGDGGMGTGGTDRPGHGGTAGTDLPHLGRYPEPAFSEPDGSAIDTDAPDTAPDTASGTDRVEAVPTSAFGGDATGSIGGDGGDNPLVDSSGGGGGGGATGGGGGGAAGLPGYAGGGGGGGSSSATLKSIVTAGTRLGNGLVVFTLDVRANGCKKDHDHGHDHGHDHRHHKHPTDMAGRQLPVTGAPVTALLWSAGGVLLTAGVLWLIARRMGRRRHI